MKNIYPKTASQVKTTYHIRCNGRAFCVRVTHLELLELLQILFGSGKAA